MTNVFAFFKLPSKNGESYGKHKGLDSDAGAKRVEGGVEGVAISRLGDRKPGVVRVEPREIQSPSDRTSDGRDVEPRSRA